EIIPNGISKKDLIKKDRKITKVKNVLSLGRQHKSKGFDQVIKIAKFFPDINFIIAGAKDNDTKRLKNLALKNTKILTNISEKEKKGLLKKADVFIHPSHYEGFGIVVLEAFANKIPVIASNKGGIPWVVGKAGLIFEDNDLKDLKNKLELLIKNNKLRNELSEKGYKQVKNFTWEKIVLDLEKTYNHTLFKFS
nr:glycosyltransferase family 4 protein [Candidatus Woesearchaeota archaeon]